MNRPKMAIESNGSDGITAVIRGLSEAQTKRLQEFVDGFNPAYKCLKLPVRLQISKPEYVTSVKTALDGDVIGIIPARKKNGLDIFLPDSATAGDLSVPVLQSVIEVMQMDMDEREAIAHRQAELDAARPKV
jgi:hypothetical protein